MAETASGIHPNETMLVEKFSLDIERGKEGLWYATSPNIKGFFLVDKTLPALLHETPWAINELEQARAAGSPKAPSPEG